jgi:hypothetical protein
MSRPCGTLSKAISRGAPIGRPPNETVTVGSCMREDCPTDGDPNHPGRPRRTVPPASLPRAIARERPDALAGLLRETSALVKRGFTEDATVGRVRIKLTVSSGPAIDRTDCDRPTPSRAALFPTMNIDRRIARSSYSNRVEDSIDSRVAGLQFDYAKIALGLEPGPGATPLDSDRGGDGREGWVRPVQRLRPGGTRD